jgi:hypothetical protein
LVLGSTEGLKRDLAEFPRELGVALRELFNPCAGIACKHSLLDNRFDRALLPTVGDKEEIPRQHQIDDLSPPVRTDCAPPNRAGDNVIPVARRPGIIENFLAAMATHNHGTWIKTFQRVGLHRKYPSVVVCCMVSRLHECTLLSRESVPFAL